MLYPWNVNNVHTNIQYLLVEFGQDRLVREGNIKLNLLPMKPTHVFSNNIPFNHIPGIRIIVCNGSKSKLITIDLKKKVWEKKFTRLSPVSASGSLILRLGKTS